MKKMIISTFNTSGGGDSSHSTGFGGILTSKDKKFSKIFRVKGNFLCTKCRKEPLISYFSQSCAFTLAEVLITIAVIGVVAALTIPTLINKYNQTVTETRLKQFYSSMNQAIQLSEIDNGSKTTWDFNEYCPTGSEYSEECLTKNFEKFLKPYLKITGYEYIKPAISNDNRLVVHFPNGSAVALGYRIHDIYFFPVGSHVTDEKHNTRNKDLFLFGFYPMYKSGQKRFEYFYNKGVEPYINGLYDGNEENLPCFKKVQLNGWKFPDECNPWK